MTHSDQSESVHVIDVARAIADSFTAPDGTFIPDNLTKSEWWRLRNALDELDARLAFDETSNNPTSTALYHDSDPKTWAQIRPTAAARHAANPGPQ